jgi:hypothetical protein
VIKGSSTCCLMILIIDTNSGVEDLLENMDGTFYSLHLLIPQRRKKKDYLNGFPLMMNLPVDCMSQSSTDVLKAQEHGSLRSSTNGLKKIQICCFFAQENVPQLLYMHLWYTAGAGKSFLTYHSFIAI